MLADTYSISDWSSILFLPVSVVALFAAIKVSEWRWRNSDQQVQTERQRLLHEVLGVRRTHSDAPEAAELSSSGEQERTESELDTRFTKLLIEYYAYGLTQSRRSFSVSLSCSMLGGAVLITGVALAIFRASSDGGQYAAVVTSVAGVVTTAIGSLFHRRADTALNHMEAQTQSLRQDMKIERDAGQAIRLLGEVGDPVLKAHLQAALILKFSAAKLPDLTGVNSQLKTFEMLMNGSASRGDGPDAVDAEVVT